MLSTAGGAAPLSSSIPCRPSLPAPCSMLPTRRRGVTCPRPVCDLGTALAQDPVPEASSLDPVTQFSPQAAPMCQCAYGPRQRLAQAGSATGGGGLAAHAQGTAGCQSRALIRPGCRVGPRIPGRRLYEWFAANAPPPPPPVCRRQHMSRCRQCRPANALGATAPYREASSGGVRGGGGGVVWGWGGGGGGLGWGAGVSCGGTYTRHRYHALPNGKNTQALSFGGFAPGLSYPRRPSIRTLAGDKTGHLATVPPGVGGNRFPGGGGHGGGGKVRNMPLCAPCPQMQRPCHGRFPWSISVVLPAGWSFRTKFFFVKGRPYGPPLWDFF